MNYYVTQKLAMNFTFNCHRYKNNEKCTNVYAMPWYVREESSKIKRYVKLLVSQCFFSNLFTR